MKSFRRFFKKKGNIDIFFVVIICFIAIVIVVSFYIYDSQIAKTKRNVSYADEYTAWEWEQSSPATSAVQNSGEQIARPFSPQTSKTGTEIHHSSSSAEPSDYDIVYLSPSGTKYHARNDCGSLNPDTCRAVTLKEALAEGKHPCKKCYPNG